MTALRRVAPAVLALLAVLLTGYGTLGVVSPPSAVAADAPSTSFSADRAREHIAALSTAAHPMGTPAHAQVRRRLVDAFTALGLAPEVRESTASQTGSGSSVIAPVHNIHAKVAGSRPTGRLLIVAHYDSALHSPGASDDGLGVGAILEIARALSQGPAPRNDIEFLLTDGEEEGLLGARAFVASSPSSPSGDTVVLNIDAAGTSGRAVMFQTGGHNAALLPALGDLPPVTTSLSDEVYRLLPHETDFTVFQRAGMTGMNFAVVGGSANYHTTQDNLANLDTGSLQDLGSTVLSAAHRLAAADLGEVRKASDATYFTLGGLLVVHSEAWVLPLAVTALLAALAVLLRADRRTGVARRPLGVAVATLPVPLVVAFALGLAGWQVLCWARPEYGGFAFGNPHRTTITSLGFAAFATAAAYAWAMLFLRKGYAYEAGAAAVLWFAGLAVTTALFFPGGSYLFAWPALCGSVGLASVAGRPATSRLRVLVPAGALGLSAAVLMLPVAALLKDSVGLALVAIPMLLVALVAAPLSSSLAVTLPGRRAVIPLAVLLVVGPALTGTGTALDRVDRAHPAPTSLVHGLDADTGRAQWLSDGTGATDWSRSYADGGRRNVEETFPLLFGEGGRYAATAPGAPAPSPVLRVRGSRAVDGGREIRLWVGTDGGRASRLTLYTRAGALLSARIGTTEVPGGENRGFASGPWKWGLLLPAPRPEGDEIVLTVRGDGPVRLLLEAQTAGLPVSPPPTETWAAHASGVSLVSRTWTV
ncbi:M28 family peptidase [Streptomyces sp. SJL17-1]|uniref:M28 family peptidase n=1 Tax=Streptomyces sp. SJL17-1 TaxID=2967223 RepID=UPI002966737A|nr:M28 family peptidase [Streptomyces sp. SJL17-1]